MSKLLFERFKIQEIFVRLLKTSRRNSKYNHRNSLYCLCNSLQLREVTQITSGGVSRCTSGMTIKYHKRIKSVHLMLHESLMYSGRNFIRVCLPGIDNFSPCTTTVCVTYVDWLSACTVEFDHHLLQQLQWKRLTSLNWTSWLQKKIAAKIWNMKRSATEIPGQLSDPVKRQNWGTLRLITGNRSSLLTEGLGSGHL